MSAETPQNQSNLTTAQFLMWMGQQMAPQTPLYNMAKTFRIRGAVDRFAFTNAFERLVHNSDALRTVITVENGIPHQHVNAPQPVDMPFMDFRQQPQKEETLHAWVAQQARRPFDLGRRLYDTALIQLEDEEFVWFINQHHLITDGWSLALVYQQLSDYYDLAVHGSLAEAEPLPPFHDYVKYEREFRNSAEFAEADAYWQEKLNTDVSPLSFYDLNPGSAGTATRRRTLSLGEGRSQQLLAAAKADGIHSISRDLSLFSIFGAVLLAYVNRISGENVLRLGTPFHNRPSPIFKNTVGLFIEVTPLQIKIDPHHSFRQLVEQVMEETFEGLRHSQPGTSSAVGNRAYQLLLNYVNVSYGPFAGMPVSSEWIHAGHGDSNHLLRVQVHDFGEKGIFDIHFDFNEDVFDERMQARVMKQYLQVMDICLQDLDLPLQKISLLTDIERRQLLVEFNQTAVNYPQPYTVVAMFRAQAQKTPEATAVIAGETTLTFRQLDEMSNQIAHALRARGIGPGDFVPLCLYRSWKPVAAMLAVLKTGAAYLPIEPAYPPARIRYMLEDAAAPMLITDSPLPAEILPQGTVQLSWETLWNKALAQPSSPPAELPAADDIAYLIYTSGSTGKPKGALLTHRGLHNYLSWARDKYVRDQQLTFPLFSSLAFDLTITSIYLPLISGGQLLIYGEDAHAPGMEIIKVFKDDQVDIVKLTPAHLALVLESGVVGRRAKQLIVGGEDFKTDLALAAHDTWQGGVTIYNEYGPTETVVGCMIHEYDPAVDCALSVPIGRPVANSQIYLLDEQLRPVPFGVTGEMYIGGHGVGHGYWRRPELNRSRFIPNPFSPGTTLYRTGDIARWISGGEIQFLGRRDQQVKIGGARIELGELESVVRTHPAILDAVGAVIPGQPSAQKTESYCKKCGLPDTFPDTDLDNKGICNWCHAYDQFADKVNQYFKSEVEFDALVSEMKQKRKGDYDCLMMLSGGKDSTYVLAQLVAKGLNVLAFSFDNGFISAGALDNVRRVTNHLNVELVIGRTPHMNAIFKDSLERQSNVCHGCYKVIYTLATNLARERNISYVVTGLSRGQLFETRLHELFRQRIFDVRDMDRAILEARKMYHRVDDAVSRLLDVEIFKDDRVFEDIHFIDYFRYSDVHLHEMYAFLAEKVPWIRPEDTGRSTNCLINEAGILVHKTERGFHNYALPYSWDVRLGHKNREDVLVELNDDIRLPMVREMLQEVEYQVKNPRLEYTENRLALYFTAQEELNLSELRQFCEEQLPDFMVPAFFMQLKRMPLTPNGKLDRRRLPAPEAKRSASQVPFAAPATPVETAVTTIWKETLQLQTIGVHDNFFELGGASVPAVQVMARLAETFHVQLPLRTIFDAPTIATLATLVENKIIADIEVMSDEEAAVALALLE